MTINLYLFYGMMIALCLFILWKDDDSFVFIYSIEG